MADREKKIEIKCERFADEVDELARALNERVYSKHPDAAGFYLAS